ncbi:RND superfamily putative drug exporter [Nocardia transvalensis]|uniref:RND superfamily putative drug exporter n=1 Tax=Nocardia transvalensis TaxID=37333 RepID=A0A7W9P9A2_9NOCA|nr:MMPL family transporter [Nocardia transvalensis]MBB5911859.1 RND superfamily putative drug exporter [Nocardia transvalensis]
MTAWARAVAGRPVVVLVAAIGFAVLCGLFGADLQSRVSAAGFTDPGSESALVDRAAAHQLGPQNPDVIAIYTVPDGQTLADLGPRVEQAAARVDPGLLAHRVETYWNNAPPKQGFLRSGDGRQALAVVYASGDDNQRISTYPDIAAALRVPGVETTFTGYSALAQEISDQSRHDLVLAESVSLPVTLAILVLVFGGVVAAALPVLVGVLAVLGSLGAVGVIARCTEVSVFAVNVASLLGLGLAIDYGLFVVSRYREELAAGRGVREAVGRAMATAGRTVLFSALLLVCAFAGTFVFPQSVLRSLGFGAIAAVVLAAALSLTVLPAALLLLGDRIGRWSWRGDAFEHGERRAARFWGRVVDVVLKRPGVVALAITAVLLGLALPLTGARLGDIDHTALPAGNEVRTTVDDLAAHFPGASSGATVLVRGDGTTSNATMTALTREIGGIPGVHQVVQVGRDADGVVLHAALDVPDRSQPATEIVTRIRELDVPDGIALQVGGQSAATVDSVDVIVSRLPLMIAVMVAATLVLLLAAFRSVVLPVKAVLMAFLSLAATFGVLSWIFYQGHLAGVLGVSVGPLSAGMMVLIIAVVFGLSTDYEVFLLSRMAEAHREGADTADAVRIGIVKTARVITAAATLLVFITGAFTLSPLTPMRFLGLGMIIALIVDATLVRMLLVPALVKLMGPVNWWPGGRRAVAATVAESEVRSATAQRPLPGG